MITALAKKIFGSRNDRLLKQYRKAVARINAMEAALQELDDDQLRNKTAEFKQRLAEGKSLDELLEEAFAVCREASRRVLGMRHFDVQLIGGMVLHEGKIAEMRTGEGKTLVATLAVYLNALTGKGVHVVTVNDYLASRDAAIMQPLYQFLGLSVGVVVSGMDGETKQTAYRADITYGTNNEYGFDYLRDNMVEGVEQRVQRELHFAVVDEVDSILIDEARTPLIISGPTQDHTEMYLVMNRVPEHLVRQETEESEGDYWVDEKNHTVLLSEAGHERAEQILQKMGLLATDDSLYSAANITLMHHLTAALRAHSLFHRDQHYVVQNGEIIIVDEFTGRLMAGRRWSDGLHQAVEAKEGVEIRQENQTLASITYQNYFRLYGKLAGMTGTADTEAYEFQSIYGLETVILPTNRPMIRKDYNDQIFRTAEEKYEAVIADIKKRHAEGQPILVGTTSIETSELVSAMLNREGLAHNVLNAKEHAREADIVAQAGKPGMITVATNMAGRGTDIVLGGNVPHQKQIILNNFELSDEEKSKRIKSLEENWPEEHEKVLAAGGLHIIGTERHESRRIDNQLRGRAGRQGDPGSSRFYLSFEDTLLRLFAMDRHAALLEKLAPERGTPIEANILTRQIEGAQRKVESRNFDMRKQILEYDDVANDQRKVIYNLRNEVLETEDTGEMMREILREAVENLVDAHMPPDSMEEQWNLPELEEILLKQYGQTAPVSQWLKENSQLDNPDVREKVCQIALEDYENKSSLIGREAMSSIEKRIFLQILDHQWREHLVRMDHLRQGIHLRGYAQKNPKQEYKRESFAMFQALWQGMRTETAKWLGLLEFRPREAEPQQASGFAAMERERIELSPSQTTATADETDSRLHPDTLAARGIIVHRNDPCPCGSGLKYKQCHGKLV